MLQRLVSRLKEIRFVADLSNALQAQASLTETVKALAIEGDYASAHLGFGIASDDAVAVEIMRRQHEAIEALVAERHARMQREPPIEPPVINAAEARELARTLLSERKEA